MKIQGRVPRLLHVLGCPCPRKHRGTSRGMMPLPQCQHGHSGYTTIRKAAKRYKTVYRQKFVPRTFRSATDTSRRQFDPRQANFTGLKKSSVTRNLPRCSQFQSAFLEKNFKRFSTVFPCCFLRKCCDLVRPK